MLMDVEPLHTPQMKNRKFAPWMQNWWRNEEDNARRAWRWQRRSLAWQEVLSMEIVTTTVNFYSSSPLWGSSKKTFKRKIWPLMRCALLYTDGVRKRECVLNILSTSLINDLGTYFQGNLNKTGKSRKRPRFGNNNLSSSSLATLELLPFVKETETRFSPNRLC